MTGLEIGLAVALTIVSFLAAYLIDRLHWERRRADLRCAEGGHVFGRWDDPHGSGLQARYCKFCNIQERRISHPGRSAA